MISNCEIRLAMYADAPAIAQMSRDFIEEGLGWSWRHKRVVQSIDDPTTNVVVATDVGRVIGFGIMQYDEEQAHLLLLAVEVACRRRGIGSALLKWLENAALTAGIGIVYLEARKSNHAARTFYRQRGYSEIGVARGYYQGREDAVRIARDLWM